jgi:hypothetical protein
MKSVSVFKTILVVLFALAVLPAIPLIAATLVLALPVLTFIAGGVAFYELPPRESGSPGVARLTLNSNAGKVH